MMYGWTFSVPTVHDFARLLRALSKHRYLASVDHSLHFAVDAALSDLGGFEEHHQAHQARCVADPALELDSRDPRLWRVANVEEVGDALALFWSTAPFARAARGRLGEELRAAGLPLLEHEAFRVGPDDGPHPELVRLDWRLLCPDELDSERHAGALRAMEKEQEEVAASEAPLIEGLLLTEPELVGCRAPTEVIFWADGPYSYCDYVFRGAAKSAKLPEGPVGYHDIDKL